MPPVVGDEIVDAGLHRRDQDRNVRFMGNEAGVGVDFFRQRVSDNLEYGRVQELSIRPKAVGSLPGERALGLDDDLLGYDYRDLQPLAEGQELLRGAAT